MNRSYWKHAERMTADILGGERNTHDKGSNVCDVNHSWLSPEVKSKKKIPDWLIEAICQAEANKEEGKLPIVSIIERGKRGPKGYMEAGMHLAVIRLETFAEWFCK